MISKGKKLYSIIRMKCPKCHQGDFFEGYPYNFKKIGEVKKKCLICDLKNSIEPGFFKVHIMFLTLWVLLFLYQYLS